MKKFTVALAFLLFATTMMAQVPARFSYQAVVRNDDGDIIANQDVTFRFSILQGSEMGTAIYAETHSIPTNDFGLANLTIGTGNVIFGALDPRGWDVVEHFLKVEIDPSGGDSFEHLGTSQLQSVPYAFHAQTVAEDMVDDADHDPENELQTLSINGSELSISDGNSVTLPMGEGGDNWGTQTVVTDETLTGLGIESNPLQIKNGGVTSAKILDESILTHDIADFQITDEKLANNSVTTEKIKIGAVTGIKIAQAGPTNGQTLKWNGSSWVPMEDLIGNNYWEPSITGIHYNGGNVGIGVDNPYLPLEINGNDYSYIKFFNSTSGMSAKDGLIVGTTPAGNPAWFWNYEKGNIHFGTDDKTRMVIGSEGQIDIMNLLNINSDVASGAALKVNGKQALWWDGTYFSWGYDGKYNFFADPITIKSTRVPGYDLVVNGSAAKTGGGSWSNLSDARLKNILGGYNKGLNEIIALQPIRFTYKDGNPRQLSSNEEQIGFIAQEVQKIFPEAVKEQADGYLDFNMHSVNVALVNAIKELKAENDQLKARLEKLENLIPDYAEKNN